METVKSILCCCHCEKKLSECHDFLCDNSSDGEDEGDDDDVLPSPVGRHSSAEKTRELSEKDLDQMKVADKAELRKQKAALMLNDLKVGLAFTAVEPTRLRKGMMALAPNEKTLIFIFSKFRSDGATPRKDFTMSFRTVEHVHTFYDKTQSEWPKEVRNLELEARERFICVVDMAPPIYIVLESKRIRDNFLYFITERTALDLQDPIDSHLTGFTG
eukprot:GEMP01063969.1.p1 GENE.GEMP01063969.1~~GEMP01063969.1.p1  ORF type:complete len:216 (+),score=45.77 GEMP01063969.1:201-848(+)